MIRYVAKHSPIAMSQHLQPSSLSIARSAIYFTPARRTNSPRGRCDLEPSLLAFHLELGTGWGDGKGSIKARGTSRVEVGAPRHR